MYLRIGPKTRRNRRFSITHPGARTKAKKEDVSGKPGRMVTLTRVVQVPRRRRTWSRGTASWSTWSARRSACSAAACGQPTGDTTRPPGTTCAAPAPRARRPPPPPPPPPLASTNNTRRSSTTSAADCYRREPRRRHAPPNNCSTCPPSVSTAVPVCSDVVYVVQSVFIDRTF